MTGGDFATGALAAGANEALVVELNKMVGGDKDLLLMASKIVGVLSATAQGAADQESLELGSWVANNATQYNFLNHQDVEDLEKALKECKDNCDAVRAEFAKRDADNAARLNNCWATGDCEKIKAEIYEGSLALNELWQNDKTGITDQFLHSNIADSTNARTRAVLDHLPKGDPANAVKFLAAAGIIALAPEAIALLGQLATRGAATCAANPVLCGNEVMIWAAEAGMSEALPVGLGVAAGGAATKELSDLRGLMEIEAKTGVKLTAEQIGAVVGPAATGAKATGGAAGKVDDLAASGLSSASSLPSGTGLGGFKVGLSADDITAINSQFGGSVSFREVDTAIANAANYDGFYNKAGSMIRDIAGGHLFDNGNKRTAVEVVEQLIIKKRRGWPAKTNYLECCR
jgi:hypothetical protein